MKRQVKQYQQHIQQGGHIWVKQNENYSYRCAACGMKGTSFNLFHMYISAKYRIKRIRQCKYFKTPILPNLVKVLQCAETGGPFRNIKPNSIHRILTAKQIKPFNEVYTAGHGIWVHGIGKPVLLLHTEYKALHVIRTSWKIKRTTKRLKRTVKQLKRTR